MKQGLRDQTANRYLTYDDISMLSAKGLSYARNEMMARMGRGFKPGTGRLF
ncbi:MAG: YARHG domain-containing protein [Blautia sp.]